MKYRFYPTPEQETLLRRTIGCTRLVYNKALAERSEAWTSGKVSLGFAEQSRRLTGWKKLPELAFLNEVSSVPLQQALRHLQTGYTNFFEKRAEYPSFKKKHKGGAATFVGNAVRFVGGAITLAKMDAPLAIVWSRPLPEGSIPSSATVTLDTSQRWHISMVVEDPSIVHLPKLDTAVGLDMGLSHLVTLSTGEKIHNLRFDDKEAKRKKRLQREVSRKKKGSKNRGKARVKLARVTARVADRRRDYLHKVSTRLVRENQVIVVEDLNIRGMVKNHKLARSIHQVGWGMFLAFLEYKSSWYGRDFVKVDRFFPSSKTCGACGHVVEHLPLDVREWVCPKCGAVHDRDVNASRNILAAGLAVSACGPKVRQRLLRKSLRSGLKQEPLSAS